MKTINLFMAAEEFLTPARNWWGVLGEPNVESGETVEFQIAGETRFTARIVEVLPPGVMREGMDPRFADWYKIVFERIEQ
jgi:hypothetical protein